MFWFAPFALSYGLLISWLLSTTTPINYRTDLGNFFTITGVFVAIYIAIKIHENTQFRELQEHQRYKERLFVEFERLISLTSLIIHLYHTGTQDENNMKNINHAKRSLDKLITINSMFNTPSHIRSKLDEILSKYDSFLDVVEHKCFKLSDPKNLESELSHEVKNFIGDKFFKNNNNENIKIEFKKFEKTLSEIATKNKSPKE